MHRNTRTDALVGARQKVITRMTGGGGTPFQPTSLSWRERFSPERYRKGDDKGDAGMVITPKPTCPGSSDAALAPLN